MHGNFHNVKRRYWVFLIFFFFKFTKYYVVNPITQGKDKNLEVWKRSLLSSAEGNIAKSTSEV